MTTPASPRLFVGGPATWNLLVYVDVLPAPHPHTEVVRAHHETVGGTSAGKALNLRSLSAEVTLRTHLGDDDAGRRVEERLLATGVDLVVERSDRTERHLNLTDAAGRRLSLHLDKPGTSPEQHADRVAAALAASEQAIVDLADEARPLLARVRDAGVPLVCDLHDYDGTSLFHQDFVDAGDVCSSTTTRCRTRCRGCVSAPLPVRRSWSSPRALAVQPRSPGTRCSKSRLRP
jgi:sugar/nucleoside kinase (ribokinase family)